MTLIYKGEKKMINDLVKKLRKAADALDDLFVSVNNEGKAKRAILKSMDKHRDPIVRERVWDVNPIEPTKQRNPSRKGFKYPAGTHWTQKPENKERVRKVARKMKRAKKAKKA